MTPEVSHHAPHHRNRPFSAPSCPVAALSPRAAHRSQLPRYAPANRPLRETPAFESAGKSATATPGPAPTPDRGSAVAVAVLDTTAQPCQSPAATLRNRARSKYLTLALVDGLTALKQSPLRHAYASTGRCATELVQDGVKVQAHYCRQRWCLVCNRIRTAKLIGAYLPEMATWPEPHFVTLTIPNVAGPQLHAATRKMLATVPRLARAIRRTDGLELRAVRKLETTYSVRRRDYHPHLHLIVSNGPAAAALVRRWLAAFPDADAKAQDVRRCEGPGAMRELFKYFTKLVVRGIDGERTAPPPLVLDTMFKAVKGLRTFQPMGFVSRATLDASDETLELDAGTISPVKPDARGVILWRWTSDDWLDYTTGELLSGYSPSDSMRELVHRITADARAAPPC